MSTTATDATGYRYVIDRDLCAGHGRCYALDPDHFDSDDVGYGVVLDKVVPASGHADMEDVAMACPEEAITIEAVGPDPAP